MDASAATDDNASRVEIIINGDKWIWNEMTGAWVTNIPQAVLTPKQMLRIIDHYAKDSIHE